MRRKKIRYRSARRRGTIVHTRRRALVYRGRARVLLPALLVAAALLVAGLLTGHLIAAGAGVGGLTAAWLAYALRLVRPLPAGPGGDGPTPPGGAAVREPRQPRPIAPAGVAARPLEQDDPPGQAAALA